MRTGTCERCGTEFVDRSQAQARRFCSENCRKRQNEQNTRKPYEGGCGRLVWRKNGGYCRACEPRRKAWHEKNLQIVAWWAEGLTMQEIGERLGQSKTVIQVHIARLRGYGYDLPYRRSAQTLVHIRAGRARRGPGVAA